jgi:O-antigen/teichoic acid export membrane protein
MSGLEALRNALANLLGGLTPAAVTLLTLPFIANTLGSENYGVLTLISAIVGYFAILDINVTAGSVKFVAQHHATGSIRLRNQTITCGLAIYAAIGAAGCLLILVFADTLVRRVFVVPDKLHATVLASLHLAAIGFLFGQTQIYLSSIPQAIRRYDRTAMVEAAFGIIVPFSTVGVLWLGYGLYEVVLVRVVASAINVGVLGVVIRRLMPDVALEWPDRRVLAELARFSGFSYLSRLTAVAYAQGDKLILGAMVSMSALTHYAVPFTLVNRLFALSLRLGAVLFPTASALSATGDTFRLRDIYLYGARYLLFINCAITTLLATMAYELLYYWIGQSIAVTGAWILIVLSWASLADSVTNAPSLVNDGLGHPRVTGLFAIARAALGIGLTIVLVARFDVEGAAYAQLITSTVMASVFLWFVHGRTVPVTLTEFVHKVMVPVLPVGLIALCIAVLRLHTSPLGLQATIGLIALEIVFLATYGLVIVLRRDDRATLMARAFRMDHAR